MASDSAFRLPARLAAKGAPELIRADERHFGRIVHALTASLADLTSRRDATRLAAVGEGQAAVDRDLEIHRLSSRARTLGRYRRDACLGRFVREDGTVAYIGRFGLVDDDGTRLLVDWRAPAAEPFFAATRARANGITSRRRYRWADGAVIDYWDEVFADDGIDHAPALDDHSAFIASLGESRTPQMRDVLGTIQADQDAIVRAGSRGALVVDGGPGTGKTVVALHRAAYLLYADPRLAPGRGGVLVVGPHRPYLSYVSDVLPSLGEESVRTCTLRDLVPEGAERPEADPRVASLKSSNAMVAAIEPAVALFEEPPSAELVVSTPWADVVLTAADWADAFASAEPGAPHNDARDQVWEEVLDILVAQHDEDAPVHQVRRALARDPELGRVFTRAWPVLDPAQVVADLWSVPAYLRRCAPHLAPDEVEALTRTDARAWTTADLPLLDAARQRVGDPEASRRRRRREAEIARERERRARVIDDLIAADDSEMLVMSMLRRDDAQNSLDDVTALEAPAPDELAGPFAHIIVDEAQELTDAQWIMLLRRCPSRSFTVVGDRAQARQGFDGSWEQRLRGAGLRDIRTATLTVNYRTPIEVMAEAEPVIRAVMPEANVPTAVRASGLPVVHASPRRLDEILRAWLSTHEGTVCVIGNAAEAPVDRRVRALAPEEAKGLEFDLVMLVEPSSFGSGTTGAVDRYVAMARATQQLVILER